MCAFCLPVFSVNVEALAAAETAEANRVLESMDQRNLEKMLNAQAEETKALVFPHPSSGGHGHNVHHRSHRHKRHSGHGGANALRSAELSPLKQVRTPFGKAVAEGEGYPTCSMVCPTERMLKLAPLF